MTRHADIELPSPRGMVAGFFEVWGRKDTRERLIVPRQRNLVLNAGLDRLGVGAPISYAHLGTGATPPVATDTTLEGWVMSTGTVLTTSTGWAQPTATIAEHAFLIKVFEFPAAASAFTLRNIGIGWSASNDSLWAAALVQDAFGAPLSVSVEAGEVLYLKYEYHLYPWSTTLNSNDSTFSLVVLGATVEGIMRPSAAGTNGIGWGGTHGAPNLAITMEGSSGLVKAYSGDIGALDGTPGGTGVNRTSVVSAPAYSSGSYKRIGTYLWNAATANFAPGGVKSMIIQPGASLVNYLAYQIGFTPGIPKTSDYSLQLTISTPVWGRMP